MNRSSAEHRLGLNPVCRRVWAPVGERPLALGHRRNQWLYVIAFVHPAEGETVWYLSNGINKVLFEKLLADFARQTGAGRERIILVVLDNAGWHSEPGLTVPVPDGIRLVYLPADTARAYAAVDFAPNRATPFLSISSGSQPRATTIRA